MAGSLPTLAVAGGAAWCRLLGSYHYLWCSREQLWLLTAAHRQPLHHSRFVLPPASCWLAPAAAGQYVEGSRLTADIFLRLSLSTGV